MPKLKIELPRLRLGGRSRTEAQPRLYLVDGNLRLSRRQLRSLQQLPLHRQLRLLLALQLLQWQRRLQLCQQSLRSRFRKVFD